MTTKKPKYNYYHVDAGHFPVHIKLCFSDKEFQKILKDHQVLGVKTNALDIGVGETHYFSDGKYGIIILALDLEECSDDDVYLAGLIAHESTHCVCRVFEHIGEMPEEIGEESRAYLTEHIVKQLTQAVKMEKDLDARKRTRSKVSKEGEGEGGLVLQVDLNDQRSAGPDSISKSENTVSGAKNRNWRYIRTTTGGVRAAQGTGLLGSGAPK